MDWLNYPVVTILATGLATTAGVWIKGILDARTDARRIKVEDTRFELEHRWADERAQVEAHQKTEGGRLESANTALKLFGAILDGVGLADTATAAETEDIWMKSFESQARQAVEFIYDAEARSDIGVILDVLEDYRAFCSAIELKTWHGFYAKGLLQVVLQLAGAAARGESRSAETDEKMKSIRTQYDLMDSANRP